MTDAFPFDPAAIQAVVFDAYGTLVRRLTRGPDPLRQLFRFRHPSVAEGELRRVLREDRSFRDWGQMWQVPPDLQRTLERELQPDLLSVLPYPEVKDVLLALRQSGRKIFLCSNLATPYVLPLQRHLSHLVNGSVLSFSTGLIKPEPAMFEAVMAKSGLPPEAHLMVGDRMIEDVEGPRALGWSAVQVARPGQKGAQLPDAWPDLTPLLDLPPLPPR